MINKYIALSALACAAILPLSAQAQSNSADADVNITLVQPIAVSYTDGSGSLGSVLLSGSEVTYYLDFSGRTDNGSPFTSDDISFLEQPTAFDFKVSGGTGLSFSVNHSFADANADDGVSVSKSGFGCDGSSTFLTAFGSEIDDPVDCVIQTGQTIVRIAPSVTVGSGASPITDGKVATLTTTVAYE